jgi:prepilin-type N-terminal cleavage/methylation domain-containing protein
MKVRPPARHNSSGFTLVELLVVMIIMGLLAALAVVGFSATNDAQNFASEVNDIQQILNDARAYAMANDTYVYVGLEEVDASVATTSTQTQYTLGKNGGRIGIGVAASIDGTASLSQTTGSVTTGDISANLVPISKLRVFNGITLMPAYATIAQSTITPKTSPLYNKVFVTKLYSVGYDFLNQGDGLPYQYFHWPLTSATPLYTFDTVLVYAPDGSARLLAYLYTKTNQPNWYEMDLESMHGTAVPNSAATGSYTGGTIATAVRGHEVGIIQIDGVSGNTQLYLQ